MSPRVRKLDPIVSCFVPTCKNKVLMNPDKHFFHVPTSARVQWCAAVNRSSVPKSGSLYICEDHLNLQEDLLNYKDWIEHKTNRPRLKPQVPDNLRNISKDASLLSRTSSVSNLLPSTSKVVVDSPPRTQEVDVDSPPRIQEVYVGSPPRMQEKGVLCVPYCANKAVQVKPTMVNCSVSAQMFKKSKPRMLFNNTFEEEATSEGQDPSTAGCTTDFSESETSTNLTVQKHFTGRCFILNLIETKPFSYIGVPKQYYWIIQYLSKELKMPSLHIIITLYKIKNNENFAKMKDLFEISLTTLWRIFDKCLKALSLFFKELIYWPTALDIKKNLPSAFTTSKEYASVQSIIDCFEIEIEKPRTPIDQALTWSQYKNCNTIKYLISATPNGFIQFVSEGYGGRISDMYLVEQSGYLEVIPSKATILADRGFKHLESHLIQKSVKVLRPPSVLKDTKMTKAEVIDSKILASLRIHIERVIRRVRLYKMLKPHAVVNNKLINVLDDAMVVACGLINLQSSVIRKY